MARSKESAKRLAELNAVAEMISFAIAREKASAEFYEKALERANTESAKKAFALLVEQEREHEKRLRAELAKIRQELSKT